MNKVSKAVASVVAVSQLFTGALAMNIDGAMSSYDFDSNMFHIEGTTEFANQPVKLEILKRDIGFGDFDSEDDLLYIAQVFSDSSKSFSFDVEVSEIGAFAYRISELGSADVYSAGFATYTDESVNKAINDYVQNEEKTAAELDKLISDYYPALDVDINLYKGLSGDAKTEMLDAINSGSFDNADEFKKAIAYNAALALVFSADSKNDKAELADKFALQLGIADEGFYADYSMLDEDSKADIVASVSKSKPYDTFCENLKNAYILSEISGCVWNAAADIIDKYLDCGAADMLDRYSGNAGKHAVEKLKSAIKTGDITKVDDMYAFLEDEAYDYDSKNSSSSSGGSGGGGRSKGGSGGSYKAPVEAVVPSVVADTPKETVTKYFNDTDSVSWAEDAIAYLYKKGVVNGKAENIFAPNDSVTREEFVKMITLAFDIALTDKKCSFEDVAEGAWYYSYVATAYEKGIISGKSTSLFGTGESIKRQDMAQILYNVLKATGAEIPEAAEITFADKDSIAEYAAKAIATLADMGCLNGDDKGNVLPEKNSTRAEAAKLIYSVITAMGR